MKKITILLAFITITLNAQKRESGSIELSPKIGYSSYTLGGDDAKDFDPVTGISFAATGDYFFNDRWSIRSGVSFDKMGARILKKDLVLNYITIPVNANWHFGGNRKWNLNFGLASSFLTNAKFDGADNKEFINSSQIALTYGIGYKIFITESFSILIDSQGLVGFNKIQKEGNLKNFNSGSSINIGGVIKL